MDCTISVVSAIYANESHHSLCCRQISRIRSCDVMFDLSSSMKPKCLKERNEVLLTPHLLVCSLSKSGGQTRKPPLRCEIKMFNVSEASLPEELNVCCC